MKNIFFNLLFETKYQIEYYKFYLERSVKVELYINCFLSVMSVGALSIAWGNKETGIIPIVFICISQILFAIKPYMPFNKRVVELNKIIGQYEYLFNDMECYFCLIDKEIDETIVQKINEYRNKRSKFQQECLKNDTLPINEKFALKAKSMAENYFENKKD